MVFKITYLTSRLISTQKYDGLWKCAGKFGHVSRWNYLFDNPLANIGIQPLVRDVRWYLRINLWQSNWSAYNNIKGLMLARLDTNVVREVNREPNMLFYLKKITQCPSWSSGSLCFSGDQSRSSGMITISPLPRLFDLQSETQLCKTWTSEGNGRHVNMVCGCCWQLRPRVRIDDTDFTRPFCRKSGR